MNIAEDNAMEPLYASVPETVRLTGLSRAWLYREGQALGIVMRKRGRRIFVDLDSVRAVLNAMPRIQEASMRKAA